MARSSGVYQIANKFDGKKYIGATVDIRKRWSVHLSELKRRGKRANRNLQEAFDKHGKDCFEFSVLEYCSEELLAEREQYFIDALEPEYNINPVVYDWHGYQYTARAELFYKE